MFRNLALPVRNLILTFGGLNLSFPTGASAYLIPWNDAYFTPLFVKIQDPAKQAVFKQTIGFVVVRPCGNIHSKTIIKGNIIFTNHIE